MADLVFTDEPAGAINQAAIPKNYDLFIYRGDYMELFVTLKGDNGQPLNLSGFTPSASLRTNYSAENAINFTCSIPEPATGRVRIYLPSSASKTLTEPSYIWDFQVANPSNDVRTFLTGDVTVYSEVTKVDEQT